ncbi:MAG: bacteriohemerythrin [Treponema sp.]|jgi:hemerythrin|nr:bacteriohemerythrin [Treponema sp.]
MNSKDALTDSLTSSTSDIVVWGDKYATGIKLIDQQHRELVDLTNNLFHACLDGEQAAKPAFMEAMHRMVEYVRFHFNMETEMLERIKYPGFSEHKKLHETLIKQILDAAEQFKEGKKFVPNHFVRTLKDWVFGHIAIHDKFYASYVTEQKKKGLLNDKMINGS